MKLIYFLGLALILGQVAHSLTIQATIRDFKFEHPDFENLASYASGPGIVQSVLGADRKPVLIGAPSITSAATFAQWYNDVPGVNMKTTVNLELTDLDNDGVFTYDNPAYFPIDNQLFGNEGAHNWAFTTEIHTTFTYVPGTKFTCVGDDDIWVFIDDNLVIDKGGPHGPEGATVDLDTLGLVPLNTYTLDIFQAERQSIGSTLRIESSALLVTDPCPRRTAARLARLL